MFKLPPILEMEPKFATPNNVSYTAVVNMAFTSKKHNLCLMRYLQSVSGV